MGLGLIAAVVILQFLLKELTIIQIFAAMPFMMALMMIQFAAFGKEIVELSDKFFEDRSIIKKAWIAITIWIVLMGWVLYEMFV